MSKNEMLRFVNLPLAFSLLTQTGTALIIFFRIKLVSKDLLFGIHRYNGLILIALALVHIILNWSWIRVTFFPARKRPVQPS